MKKYVKKPIVIEAAQWNGSTLADAKKFCKENNMPDFQIGSLNGTTGLLIHTLEGDHIAKRGDFIIKGIAGEYYPCKEDIFWATYEKGENNDKMGKTRRSN